MKTSLLPSRWTRAAAYAAVVAMSWIVISTIVADLNRAYWEWLRDIFGHHWLGKGYVAVAMFTIVFIAVGQTRDQDGRSTNRAITIATWSAVIGTLILLGLFTVWPE